MAGCDWKSVRIKQEIKEEVVNDPLREDVKDSKVGIYTGLELTEDVKDIKIKKEFEMKYKYALKEVKIEIKKCDVKEERLEYGGYMVNSNNEENDNDSAVDISSQNDQNNTEHSNWDYNTPSTSTLSRMQTAINNIKTEIITENKRCVHNTKKKSKREKYFKCNKCSKKFLCAPSLKHHKDKFCKVMFKSKSYTKKYSICPKKNFQCEICSKKYFNAFIYKTHVASHTEKRLFNCDICKKGFLLKISMLRHRKMHSEVNNSVERAYKCGTCNMKFRSYPTLKMHEQSHVKREIYFRKSKEVSKNHMKSLLKQPAKRGASTQYRLRPLKQFRCVVCRKSFIKKSSLNRHIKLHPDFRPLRCVICNKRFKVKSCLIQHEKLHVKVDLVFVKNFTEESFSEKHELTSKQRESSCEICELFLSRKLDQQCQERLHLSEQVFYCNVCKKYFKNKSKLEQHQKLHMEVSNTSFNWRHTLEEHEKKQSTGKVFCCDKCGKVFKSVFHLKSHDKIHSEKPFHCKICQLNFRSKITFEIHRKLHFGGSSYKCNFCNGGFEIRNHFTCHKQLPSKSSCFYCDICKKNFKMFTHAFSHKRVHWEESRLKCGICGKMFKIRILSNCYKCHH